MTSQPDGAVSADDMVVSVNFAVRMRGPLLAAPSEALVDETRTMLQSIVQQLMSQHPHADLQGDVGVSIQLMRD
jgi:hypothetical protein